MNDLTTQLRQMADQAQQASPPAVAEILENGDRMRRRTFARRSAAGALAVAAVVAVAVASIQPGAQEARQPSAQDAHQQIQLADWTVAMEVGGGISLTIRQFADTALLQQTLRADGVPASVLAEGQADPCLGYGYGTWLARRNVVTVHRATATIVTIHPSALPSGAGLQISPSANIGHGPGAIGWRLVQASQACTGS